MMHVLLCLAGRPGELVTRAQLLDHCWKGAPVGDDSLNRAVAGIRRATRRAGIRKLQIETVAGAGYVLRFVQAGSAEPNRGIEEIEEALSAAWRSWRLGLPEPDRLAIHRLQSVVSQGSTQADAWGMLALLLRHAAEHAEAGDCPRYVEDCRTAADKALLVDPDHATARTALTSLPLLYGDWWPRRSRLLEILTAQPDNMPAAHDLAVLEMATGRPSAAVPLIEELMEREPLAAIFHYKRTYHLWTLGKLSDLDQVADRAMQLWPRHPAIWFARFWSLAFTGRAPQAAQQLADSSLRPFIPPPALVPLEKTLHALLEPENDDAKARAVRANLESSARGPAQSVAAIIQLSGIGAVEDAIEVAESYFARAGKFAVSQRKTETDPSVTDQHRRVTQMLFIPPTEALRASPRFSDLCRSIGLTEYWSRSQLSPDYRPYPDMDQSPTARLASSLRNNGSGS